MNYVDPKSYKESAERVLVLAERLLLIKRAGHYSDEDARGVALTNCRSVSLYAVMILNILTIGEERKISSDDFKRLVGLTRGQARDAGDILEKTTRLAFLVLFQFQIENLLRNLLHEVNGGDPLRQFYNLAREFTQTLSDPTRKLEIMNTAALIRNSLHANGVHHGYRGSSTFLEISGCRFEFRHLQKVSCAGWGHIVVALDASTSVVEEILNLPQVRSLHEPVMDQYAWEEATRP